MATWVNAPMKTGKPYTPFSTMRSRGSAMTFGIEARSSHLWEVQTVPLLSLGSVSV